MNPLTAKKLEITYKVFKESQSNSLLKKYLTPALYEKLRCKTTCFGSTLFDCVQSGFYNLDSGCGIYAPDPEAYTVFAKIFDPIIEDYHIGFKKGAKHPVTDWGNFEEMSIGDLDPHKEFIVSTRVRCARSIAGYPLNPKMTECQYKEIQNKMKAILGAFRMEKEGTYYPLLGMKEHIQKELIDDHFLFKEGDRFLQAAQASRFWPIGRGIFHNKKKTFLVWVNEEDHIRIISMQPGGNLGQVYQRLYCGAKFIEDRIKFSKSPRFGYITFCPTNLGTTIRASVHIKLPKLASNQQKLEEVAKKFNLQVRGTRGEHSAAEGGIYDVSNKRRLGLTEFEAIKEMHDGVLALIDLEKTAK